MYPYANIDRETCIHDYIFEQKHKKTHTHTHAHTLCLRLLFACSRNGAGSGDGCGSTSERHRLQVVASGLDQLVEVARHNPGDSKALNILSAVGCYDG